MDKTFKNKTDWGHVAAWYDAHLAGDDTYHAKVIVPNLSRLINSIQGKVEEQFLKGKIVLDLACGQGYFTQIWAMGGAKKVYGVDLGLGLIKIGQQNAERVGLKNIEYIVSPADNLEMIKDNSVDIVTCVLAIQNIEEVRGVFDEVSKKLVKGGRMYVVLNHPSFRNPRQTHWVWDTEKASQYRRVDEYISESKAKIDMNPGAERSNGSLAKNHTWSFHRPLQYYFKAINKAGLCVGRLEEWISHKQSQNGPRQTAEDKSRKEIPMFMMLEIIKV